MRFLKVHYEIKQIKKEIQDDLHKIIFYKDSSSKKSKNQVDFSASISSLISEYFENFDLSPLIDYLFSFLTERDDESKFEVFNLFCFLSQFKKESNSTSFALLMGLIDQKEFFDNADIGIKAFGILLNLEKQSIKLRVSIFERLFRFVKLNNSSVLYKYTFDIQNAIGPIDRELHGEVLQYGLAISSMKDLWQNFAKLLLIQAQLYAESDDIPKTWLEKLKENLLQLVSSVNGVFYLKSLNLNSHLHAIMTQNTTISNLIEALEKGECSVLNKDNETNDNKEKVNIVKLMKVVEKKCNWELGKLSTEIFGDTEQTSTKKIQGLLMKCMKLKLIRAKINRKENSVLIT